jgi:hypothetical protein
MRKLAMFLAAALATVVLQTTLGPATPASADPGSKATTASTLAVEAASKNVAAGTWLHWDNYYSEDFCEFMGAMGMLGNAWQNFYCVYDWSVAPWALHVYFA